MMTFDEVVVTIRGGPRDGETRVVPVGMRELRFVILTPLSVAAFLDKAEPGDELKFDEVRLRIDPDQAALGVPLQWPQEEE